VEVYSSALYPGRFTFGTGGEEKWFCLYQEWIPDRKLRSHHYTDWATETAKNLYISELTLWNPNAPTLLFFPEDRGTKMTSCIEALETIYQVT
jgi:hypothetical protein